MEGLLLLRDTVAAPHPPATRNLPQASLANLAAENNELQAIHRRVPKEKLPHTIDNQINSPVFLNEVQQADLLFMPTDPHTQQKYVLVVVDLATRRVGAVGLTAKSAPAIRAGLIMLYLGDPLLAPPKRLEVDSGTEFKGTAKNWLIAQGTFIRRGRPGRSKQQAVVEAANRVIGSALQLIQQAKELQNWRAGAPAPNLEWSADLPAVVEELNSRWERSANEMLARQIQRADQIQAAAAGQLPTVCDGISCDVIALNSQVRLRHEKSKPTDVLDDPAGGRRRAADPHFSTKPRRVQKIFFIPGKPVRYRISGFPHTTFAREEIARWP